MITEGNRSLRLQLTQITGERDRLERLLDLRRVELARIVRAPGGAWSDPRAQELKAEIEALTTKYEAANEELRSVKGKIHDAKSFHPTT